MKKYSKKIALILVLALSLTLAIPVLAEKTDIEGSYLSSGGKTIDVTVLGGDVKAYLNPGKVDAYWVEDDATTVINPSGQITTMPIIGVNRGGKLSVRASVTSSILGNFKFASSAPKEDAKNTSGLVYLEAKQLKQDLMADVKDKDGNVIESNEEAMEKLGYVYSMATGKKTIDEKTGKEVEIIDECVLNSAAVLEALNTEWTKSTSRDDYKNNLKSGGTVVVLKKGTATSKNALCSVEGAKTTKVEGEDVTTPTYFAARLTGWLGKGGDAAKNKAWKESDGFAASVIWSFETDAS